MVSVREDLIEGRENEGDVEKKKKKKKASYQGLENHGFIEEDNRRINAENIIEGWEVHQEKTR